jgi:hypothetical protein
MRMRMKMKMNAKGIDVKTWEAQGNLERFQTVDPRGGGMAKVRNCLALLS